MPTGNWFDAVTPAGVTAWADVATDRLTSNPSIVQLDLVTGAETILVSFNGDLTDGVIAASGNTAIATVASPTADGGKLVVTPVAVGSTTIVLGPYSTAPAKNVSVTVVDTTVVGDVTALTTTTIPTVTIGGAPFTIRVLDQDGDPLPGTASRLVEVDISKPGYLTAAHASLDGYVTFYPRGVGVASVTFTHHNRSGTKVTLTVSIEVEP